MEKYVTLSTGVRMEYVEKGDPSGLPVIFLHGVTDSWHSFERVLPLLPPAFHAFALSARGHGDSSKPETGYRISDMSRDVAAFMDALDLPRAVIVGHSMGSMVAQRFVVDHPERVSGLVLIGAFPSLYQDANLTDYYRSAIAPLTDPIDAGFAREWQLSTLARPMPEDHLDTVVVETQKVPSRVWRAAFAGFLETPDFSADLARVKAPTLIQWGDQDTYTSRANQDRLRSVIPGAKLEIYEGNGHAVHWESPVEITGALVSFLTSRVRSRPEAKQPELQPATTR
jgi:pimeloyl-ACP methyl ester carboxylesterase